MALVKDYTRTMELLHQHGQEHLLAFYQQLDNRQKRALLDQIALLDFAKIPGWITDYVINFSSDDTATDFAPAPSYPPTPLTPDQHRQYDRAKELGTELLTAGKVAAFVVAGGQGTRLGFDGPKGNFPISPVKNRTLFELFAETILAAGKKYSATFPWYVMTSPLNHTETLRIFESQKYFGLDRSDVFIFPQGSLPNFDFDGKILLSDKATCATSPNGHGGSLKALYDSGAIDDMKNRGIEYISYFQVDNPLINIFDPLFIGLHAAQKAEMSSKALIKTNPTEKVGNFCLVNGKVTVIEYSDLPDDQAARTNHDGPLVFELGSIAIHIISVAFVEKLNASGFALPIHRAVKKIPCIDLAGNPVSATAPNGIKLETFVFDALPLSAESVILQTVREEEFAPVKNATDTDSAEVARRMMTARSAAWLESAGIAVPRKPDGSVDCTIEIAPSFAIHKADITARIDEIPAINPGDTIYLA